MPWKKFVIKLEIFLNNACSHWLFRGHMTSNNETVSGQKIKSRAELRILWSSEVEHNPIYQNILKMNPCHGLSVISLDWITVYCSLTCRRNVDSCKICCDDDGEDKVGCDGFAQYFHANCLRVDYHPFFFIPVDSQRHKLFLFDKPHTMGGRPLTFKGAIRDI